MVVLSQETITKKGVLMLAQVAVELHSVFTPARVSG